VVVVHATNETRALSRDAVSRLFLKKVKRWPDGAPALPVDLGDSSPVRAAFSRDVLGREVSSVRAYWQTRIFSGQDTPPPERASDADALAYVRGHAGAIAYVAPGTALPADVRPLEVVR
jgi:ABC-type phosphate transport system substrate-binding protein